MVLLIYHADSMLEQSDALCMLVETCKVHRLVYQNVTRLVKFPTLDNYPEGLFYYVSQNMRCLYRSCVLLLLLLFHSERRINGLRFQKKNYNQVNIKLFYWCWRLMLFSRGALNFWSICEAYLWS